MLHQCLNHCYHSFRNIDGTLFHNTVENKSVQILYMSWSSKGVLFELYCHGPGRRETVFVSKSHRMEGMRMTRLRPNVRSKL